MTLAQLIQVVVRRLVLMVVWWLELLVDRVAVKCSSFLVGWALDRSKSKIFLMIGLAG